MAGPVGGSQKLGVHIRLALGFVCPLAEFLKNANK